jgi:hypothetical protein
MSEEQRLLRSDEIMFREARDQNFSAKTSDRRTRLIFAVTDRVPAFYYRAFLPRNLPSRVQLYFWWGTFSIQHIRYIEDSLDHFSYRRKMRILLFFEYLFSLVTIATAATPEEWRPQSIYFLLTDRFARSDNSTTAPCDTSARVGHLFLLCISCGSSSTGDS